MEKIFRALFLIFLILQIFSGCQKKENDYLPVLSENNFTQEQAQAWFGSEDISYFTLKSGNTNSKTIGIKPDWCNSIQSQNDREELVEVGLWMMGGFGFADEDSYKEWTNKKDPVSIGCLTRLVFLKSKDDGKIINFLMTIVGDNNYHHDKASQLSKNSYLSKEKNFSGYVFYHDLNGNFVNGWKYEKGSVVAKTTMTKGGNIPTQLKLATTCTESTVYQWITFTTGWYQTSNTYEGTMYLSEETSFYVPVTTTSCTGDGGGGGSPTVTVSTGGYSPIPSPPPPIPNTDPNLPCPGDPIKNASIAATVSSGQRGGMYGCNRTGGTNCSEGQYNKWHGGIDIFAPENSDLYSITSGKVSYIGFDDQLGNFVQVTSLDNNTKFLYAHLNSVSVNIGVPVNIGSKLGLTGKTGNANQSNIIPHVHIQVQENNYAFDPQPYISTKFNVDGSISSPCSNSIN